MNGARGWCAGLACEGVGDGALLPLGRKGGRYNYFFFCLSLRRASEVGCPSRSIFFLYLGPNGENIEMLQGK